MQDTMYIWEMLSTYIKEIPGVHITLFARTNIRISTIFMVIPEPCIRCELHDIASDVSYVQNFPV